MARATKKDKELTTEEKLAAALVPEAKQPYPVPKNWCWVILGNLVEIRRGASPRPIKAFITECNDGVNWIKIGDTDSGKYVTHVAEKVTQDGAKKSVFVNKGTLLLSNSMSFGRPYILEVDGCIHDGWLAITPGLAFDKEYLYYGLLASDWYFERVAVGTAVRNLNSNRVATTPIPLPPLAEQKRIVDIVESLFADLDAAKEKLTAVLDGFAERKSAILHQAFTGELTVGWRKERGKHFSEWKTSRLEDCFDIVGGIQKQPSRKPNKNPVPYITVANVYRDRIDTADLRFFEVFDGELEKYQLCYGDILVVEGNGSGNEIGRCAMWRNELPVCIHQNHIIRVRKKDDSILPEYVLYYLNSSMGNRIMKERARTTAGLYSLSTGKIKTIPFPQASVDEQKEIVRILNELFDKEQQAQAAVEEVLADIDILKKSILARVFRGELGTGNPADESARELLRRVL